MLNKLATPSQRSRVATADKTGREREREREGEIERELLGGINTKWHRAGATIKIFYKINPLLPRQSTVAS